MQVGSKVICINDSIDAEKLVEISKDVPNWVKKDEIYTIREILDNDDIVTGVLLEEVSNPKLFFKIINKIQEPAFGLFRFREITPPEVKSMVVSKEKKLTMV